MTDRRLEEKVSKLTTEMLDHIAFLVEDSDASAQVTYSALVNVVMRMTNIMYEGDIMAIRDAADMIKSHIINYGVEHEDR